MSKFGDFLTSKKLDARRVANLSKKLERKTSADNTLIATKKEMKAGKTEKNEETMKQKPRSGRPVTLVALNKAVEGKTITGPTKTRILRAVNALLAQKKAKEVTLKDLF